MRVIEPLGYVDVPVAGARARALVVTDSGGIQEETTILDVPCLTMRPNTERPITITPRHEPAGRPGRGRRGRARSPGRPLPARRPAPPLWDGHAGERIASEIVDWLADRAEGSGAAGTAGSAA